jgi:hypothetical protein
VDRNLQDIKFQKELHKSRSPEEQALHQDMKKYLQKMGVREYEEFLKGMLGRSY